MGWLGGLGRGDGDGEAEGLELADVIAGRWLADGGQDAGGLSLGVAERFLAARRAVG